MKKFSTFFFASLCVFSAAAQPSFVGFQAESGALTSNTEWTTATVNGATVVRITTNLGGQNPASVNRMITYSVTFPQAGTYSLYARLYVNSGGFNDDSYYYGNGFGVKSPTNDNDWMTVNGLASGGFTNGTDYVNSTGSAGINVFKWVNMSVFNPAGSGTETPITFVVPAGNLTQTFQIGAREDGLDIDRFVFGLTSYNYTVGNLDNGENGSDIPPPPPYNPPGPPIATGKSKFLGGVYSQSQKTNFDKYWNQVTPENAGKWGSVEATRNVMNWTELDEAYTLAKTKGFPFKMHTLIWGAQQPTWMESLSTGDQLAEINEWFSAVAQRYPAIDIIEVVNEPLHQKPDHTGGGGNYINALGGAGASGWEWVLRSFRLARQYFPNAKLWLNDYSIINSTSNTSQYMTLVNLLKAENLIDGVGEQGHAFTTFGTPASTLTTNLNSLATLGLPLYITELDIDGAPVQTTAGDNTQLTEYQRVFPLFWTHPAVKGVTLWGYRPGHWRSAQGAYLAYDNGAERPALVWLRSYVQATPLPVSLTAFAAVKKGMTARLSWSANNEINNDHYEIERSADGFAFTPLLKVAGAGGQYGNDYNVEDALPLTGKNYYRLVQYDKDGRKAVWGTRMLSFDRNGSGLSVQIFPNPATSFVTILTAPAVRTAMITDAAGKLVRTVPISSGGRATVGTAELAAGIYYVKVSDEGKTAFSKIVVNKK